jgi:hypothetical protein
MNELESASDSAVKMCKRGLHLLTPDNLAPNGAAGNGTCRACKNATAKIRRLANLEKARESEKRRNLKHRRSRGMQEGNANARKTHCAQGHEYTEENTYWYGPDKKNRQCNICRAQRVRESWARHREKRLAEQRERYAADPEKYREGMRRWQQENREHSNLLGRLKKQRRRAAGTLSVADWELVLDVYGRACLACGKDEVTIDHVVPVSRGGANDISNVQPLCNWCNTSKATKTIDYRPEPWNVVMARADAVA